MYPSPFSATNIVLLAPLLLLVLFRRLKPILKASDLDLWFLPLPVGSHLQTIIGSRYVRADYRSLKSETVNVTLTDGDVVSLEMSTPLNWDKKHCGLIVHGLGGSHKSAACIRMAIKFNEMGFAAARMNLRGCGSGKGKSVGIPHLGTHADVVSAVKEINSMWKDADIVMVGYSMGGFLVLRAAAEMGSRHATEYKVRQVIAVSPPVDIIAADRAINSFLSYRLYGPVFISTLRRFVKQYEGKSPEFENLRRGRDLYEFIPRGMSAGEFDDQITSQFLGYRDRIDYYNANEVLSHIPEIVAPTRIISSTFDPVSASEKLRSLVKGWPANVEYTRRLRAGHCEFLGIPGIGGGFDYLERQIAFWVANLPEK